MGSNKREKQEWADDMLKWWTIPDHQRNEYEWLWNLPELKPRR